jgi:hypothetical protein
MKQAHRPSFENATARAMFLFITHLRGSETFRTRRTALAPDSVGNPNIRSSVTSKFPVSPFPGLCMPGHVSEAESSPPMPLVMLCL